MLEQPGLDSGVAGDGHGVADGEGDEAPGEEMGGNE